MNLIEKIDSKQAIVAVVGLGYVGLPVLLRLKKNFIVKPSSAENLVTFGQGELR